MDLQLIYSKDYVSTYRLYDPLSAFKMILGKERIEQYELNNFPITLVYEFMNGMAGKREKGILTNLIGFELNIHVVRVLRNMNAENIKAEVGIQTNLGNTSIDCIATFNVPQKFKRVLPSMKEEPFYVSGENTFENKATKRLNKETFKNTLMQLRKTKTIYSYTNIIILADTKITQVKCKKLYDEGTNIIRSVVSRNDLINNLLNIQKQIRVLH